MFSTSFTHWCLIGGSIEIGASRDEQIFVREIERGYASILRQASRARKLIYFAACFRDGIRFARARFRGFLPLEIKFANRIVRIFSSSFSPRDASDFRDESASRISQLGPDLASRRKLRYNTFLRSFVIFVFRYRSINRKLYEVFGSFYTRGTSIPLSIKLKI